MGLLEARDDKETKLPYNARSGRPASSTDPLTWSDFSTVLAAFEEDDGYSGIGFVFSEADDIIGYDADNVLDAGGKVNSDTAAWLLDELAGAYVEISPSGKGFKCWARGQRPTATGRNVGGFEAYSRGRFFTVTGRLLNGPCAPLPLMPR